MVKIVDMDENAPIKAQLEEDVGTVILLNKFTANPEDIDQFLKVFETTTKFKATTRFYLGSVTPRYCWKSHIH